jgi:hypothetical protein
LPENDKTKGYSFAVSTQCYTFVKDFNRQREVFARKVEVCFSNRLKGARLIFGNNYRVIRLLAFNNGYRYVVEKPGLGE